MNDKELLVIINSILSKIEALDYLVDARRIDSERIAFVYNSGRQVTLKLTEFTTRGADGRDGVDGADGNSIEAISADENGNLIIQTTREEFNLGELRALCRIKDGADGRDGVDGRDGIDGAAGADGNGITNIYTNEANELLVITDNQAFNLGALKELIQVQDGKDGEKGEKGDKGDQGERGADGERGERGNGIVSIRIDRRGNLIIRTDDKEYNLGVIRKIGSGGGGGTEEFKYTNTLPMPSDVGGLPAGTTFNNVGLRELWTRLLYAFEDPIFTAFDINGLPAQLEVGDAITAGTYQSTWNIDNPEMLEPDSIRIEYLNDSLVLADNLPNTGSADVVLPQISFSTATTISFKIQAMNTMQETFFLNKDIPVQNRIYLGESPLSILPDSQAVTDLRFSELTDDINGEYQMLGGGYKWFCYPAAWGDRNNFYDVATGLSVPMAPGFLVLVTNSFGLEITYRAYRTYFTLGGDIKIGIS